MIARDHGIDENDNNNQRIDKVEGGEHRSGRKSQYKNDQLEHEGYPTQFKNNKKR